MSKYRESSASDTIRSQNSPTGQEVHLLYLYLQSNYHTDSSGWIIHLCCKFANFDFSTHQLIHLLYYALTFVFLILLCVCSLQETYFEFIGFNGRVFQILSMVPTFVTTHTFCASSATRVVPGYVWVIHNETKCCLDCVAHLVDKNSGKLYSSRKYKIKYLTFQGYCLFISGMLEMNKTRASY